jgi:membrane protease subunit HflC
MSPVISRCWVSTTEVPVLPAPGSTQRELDSIRSGAYKQSETIKGEADRKAAAIYTAAYASEPDFYEFWKAVESYRTLLPNFRKTLTKQPAYFKYLYNKNGK